MLNNSLYSTLGNKNTYDLAVVRVHIHNVSNQSNGSLTLLVLKKTILSVFTLYGHMAAIFVI